MGPTFLQCHFFILLDLWPLVLPHPHAHHLPALYSGLGSPEGETGEGRGGVPSTEGGGGTCGPGSPLPSSFTGPISSRPLPLPRSLGPGQIVPAG